MILKQNYIKNITMLPYILHSHFLLKTLLSCHIQKEIIKRQTGLTAKGIKSKRFVEIPIPLPPLAEQRAIVERVDKLLAMVDDLEQQVAERKDQAELLLQSVLREAFEG